MSVNSAYERASVGSLCWEAIDGVSDGALLRALRAQGLPDICAQVWGSSLVPRPFSRYLRMAHTRDNAVATSPSCVNTLKSSSSGTSQIEVKVSSAVL